MQELLVSRPILGEVLIRSVLQLGFAAGYRGDKLQQIQGVFLVGAQAICTHSVNPYL